MFDKFLNFYSKYPWVAIVIITHWLATALVITYAVEIDIASILGWSFAVTIIYAYFGFKSPKSF